MDLETLGPAVEARAATWARLGVGWEIQPVLPNHGKPVVKAEFESPTWLGDIMVWITGEAELATVRLADDWFVNKHYNLISGLDVEVIVDELAALLAGGTIPESAIATHQLGLDKS